MTLDAECFSSAFHPLFNSFFQVENFTVSFSDGRALCYLLHYYHPNLLPLDLIRQETTLTRNPGVHDNSDSEEEEGIITDSWVGSYSPGELKDVRLENRAVFV